MCQIHFIYNKNKLDKEDKEEFIKLMCFGSLSNNKDAWGIFDEDNSIKRSGEFDPRILKNQLYKGNFIVGHNRLATMGVGPIIEFGKIFKRNNQLSRIDKDKIEERQHHPFELGDFLLVHNGVITNADDLFKKYKIISSIKTDSFAIIYLINYYFKISKESERRMKIIDSIKKTTKKLKGFYSVILHDQKDNSLYYFKNNHTLFSLNLIEDKILVGSSRKINLEYTYVKRNKKDIYLKNDTIYLIGEGEELFKKIGVISKNKTSNIKKEVMENQTGKVYDWVNALTEINPPYQIDENFILTINLNKKNKEEAIKNIKRQRIKFEERDDEIIINLKEEYNGNEI